MLLLDGIQTLCSDQKETQVSKIIVFDQEFDLPTFDHLIRIVEHFFRLNHPRPSKHYESGRGGGRVVSVLAFCSNDPSSNPADH